MLYIPAVNFPVLPVNSDVEIVIPGIINEGEFHDFIISCYAASNLHGNSVYINWNLFGQDGRERELKIWGKLIQHAHEFDENVWYLIHTIDFNMKKKLSPRSK